MKFHLIAVGKAPAWIEAGVTEYAKRVPELVVDRISDKPTRSRIARLFKRAAKLATVVVLDKSGHEWSSEQLAKNYRRWCHGSGDVGFLVGDEEGFGLADIERADMVWSLSKLTFPHALVRLMLCEQLYRARSIVNGHAYHRA